MFLNPNNFSNLNTNCSNLLHLRNLQEQVKKAFCYQKLFWPLTVLTICSSDLKIFANSWHSASNFKSFSRSLEHFFLIVGHNNFGNKIPFITFFQMITGNVVTVLKRIKFQLFFMQMWIKSWEQENILMSFNSVNKVRPKKRTTKLSVQNPEVWSILSKNHLM